MRLIRAIALILSVALPFGSRAEEPDKMQLVVEYVRRHGPIEQLPYRAEIKKFERDDWLTITGAEIPISVDHKPVGTCPVTYLIHIRSFERLIKPLCPGLPR